MALKGQVHTHLNGPVCPLAGLMLTALSGPSSCCGSLRPAGRRLLATGLRSPAPPWSRHPCYPTPLPLQTSLGAKARRNVPNPTAGRAGRRSPGLGSRLPGAEPLGRLLFALGEGPQALSTDNFGTKQFPKAALLTNEGFQAFVRNPMLFSLQTAGENRKRRRDDLEC